MAEVKITLGKPVALANTDTTIEAANKNGKLGKLLISRGGLEWWPASNSAYRHKVSWEKFASLLESQVSETRDPKKPKKPRGKAGAKSKVSES